jgi:hypothetical protein
MVENQNRLGEIAISLFLTGTLCNREDTIYQASKVSIMAKRRASENKSEARNTKLETTSNDQNSNNLEKLNS